MYYLPLPKFNASQLEGIRQDLLRRGFSVTGSRVLNARRDARDGSDWLAIRPDGLAWSPSDLLDDVVPSIIRVMDARRSPAGDNPYFVSRRGPEGYEVHLFLRLESLARWSSLRSQGECGLTPDEALTVEAVLSESDEPVECITDYPTDGCSSTQVGGRAFYRSRIPAPEFLSTLRTISTPSRRKNSYLTRTSVIRLKERPGALPSGFSARLGEWCFLTFS